MIVKEVKVTDIDGSIKLFKSVAEAAKAYGMAYWQIKSRIDGMVSSEMRKFEYTGRRFNIEPHNKKKDGEQEKPFNPEGYNTVPYETLGTRLCITECKIMKGVKIGSVKCKSCGYHKDQSRELHLVACDCKKV